MKYDIERIHADCVRWFESGVLEPWMEDTGVQIKKTEGHIVPNSYWLFYAGGTLALLDTQFNPMRTVAIIVCARLIGLDLPVESRVRRRVYRVYRKFRMK